MKFLIILLLFVHANSIARQPVSPHVGQWKLVTCKVNGKQIKSPDLMLELSNYISEVIWQEKGISTFYTFTTSNSTINCNNRKSFYYKYLQKATYMANGNLLYINGISKLKKCELVFARVATINIDTITPAIYFDTVYLKQLNNLFFEAHYSNSSIYANRYIQTNEAIIKLNLEDKMYSGKVHCAFIEDSIGAIVTFNGTLQDSMATNYPFYLQKKYIGMFKKMDTCNFKLGNSTYTYYNSFLQILGEEQRYTNVYNQKPWASKYYLIPKLKYRNNCYAIADYITVNFDTMQHTMSINCTDIKYNPIQLTYNFYYNTNGEITISKINSIVDESLILSYQIKELENILLQVKQFKMRLNNIILIADMDNIVEILNQNQLPYRTYYNEY